MIAALAAALLLAAEPTARPPSAARADQASGVPVRPPLSEEDAAVVEHLELLQELELLRDLDLVDPGQDEGGSGERGAEGGK